MYINVKGKIYSSKRPVGIRIFIFLIKCVETTWNRYGTKYFRFQVVHYINERVFNKYSSANSALLCHSYS